MASKLTNTCLMKTAARSLATKAAPKQAAGSSGALQVDKVPSGATIVSVDNNEALSRVGVFLRAGSRFAPVAGLSHVLNHCGSGGMSTPQRTGLNMVRTAEQLGATSSMSVGREVAMYSMASYRDCVDESLSILSSVTGNTNYAFHEYPNESELVRLKASLKISSVEKVKDLAVKAAYRSQSMGNSLYTPDYNIEKISAYQVNDFVQATHGSQGLIIVGSGVEHEVLLESASAMGVQNGGVASVTTPAKYLGGDIRLETGGDSSTVVVFGEGAKYASADSLALMVAAELLGGSSSLSYSEGSLGVLNRALKDINSSAAGISESWSDTGLFGFSLQCSANDAPKAVKSIVSAIKNMSAGEKDVAAAKATVISRIMASGYGCSEVESIGTQMLLTGSYYPVTDAVRAIESVTPASINKAVAKSFSGKLTVASMGNVNEVPYADTL